MKTLSKILIGSATIGLFAAATPAAAQNPYGYPSNNPYGYQGNNNAAGVIGSIINNALGYGQYPYGNYGYNQGGYRSSQVAIDQCARATEARLNNYAMNNQYNRWSPNQNQYNGWAVRGQARVLGIDNVQVKKYGRLKVTGVATSGRQYQQGYGYGGYQYNRSYGTPDLKFSCRADSSGRVYDVDITRMSYYGRNR